MFGRLVLSSVVFLSLAGFAQSQSLSGIRVGEVFASSAKPAQAPVATDEIDGYALTKWKLPNGNYLSVTRRIDGDKIVYAEVDWDGSASGAVSDFAGFRFGETTLADIRAKLGSNGFAFSNHVIKPMPDGSLMSFNSYEVEGSDTIVVFMTKTTAEGLKDLYEGNDVSRAGTLARLDGLILAQPEYLATNWGPDRILDPTYFKIASPN